jgi:hypothetical protein
MDIIGIISCPGDTAAGESDQGISGRIEKILRQQMPVTFAYAGVDTFYLDLEENPTVLEIVGIKKKVPPVISKTPLNLGINVVDAEIEVGMFLINFPGTNFGLQRGGGQAGEKNDDEEKRRFFVHVCLQVIKGEAPLDTLTFCR